MEKVWVGFNSAMLTLHEPSQDLSCLLLVNPTLSLCLLPVSEGC